MCYQLFDNMLYWANWLPLVLSNLLHEVSGICLALAEKIQLQDSMVVITLQHLGYINYFQDSCAIRLFGYLCTHFSLQFLCSNKTHNPIFYLVLGCDNLQNTHWVFWLVVNSTILQNTLYSTFSVFWQVLNFCIVMINEIMSFKNKTINI